MFSVGLLLPLVGSMWLWKCKCKVCKFFLMVLGAFFRVSVGFMCCISMGLVFGLFSF